MSLRFFEVSEAGIHIQNPFSEQKLMLVGEICHELGYLQPGTQLLDLACGQGEMLCRWAQLYGITGTGVDFSEAFLQAARQRAAELGVTSQVDFVIKPIIGQRSTSGCEKTLAIQTQRHSSWRLRIGSVLTWCTVAISDGEYSCCK
jgi:SAM-dependent methyltransferase